LVAVGNRSVARYMVGFAFRRQRRKADINSEFPHQVALRVPSRGLRALLAHMDTYCAANLMPHRTRRDMRGRLRYCFLVPEHADIFANNFGGEKISVSSKDRR
jgi:hypothetical protein